MQRERELRMFQRRGILQVVFPAAHPYVVNCCANDSFGMDRQAMVDLMNSKWLPMQDRLVQERHDQVTLLESNPPKCYGDELPSEQPKKEKKKKSRVQGGGATTKPKAKLSAPGGEWTPNTSDANALAVARPLTKSPVDVVRPGLIIMKKILPLEVQQHFADVCCALGTPTNGMSGGWWKVHENGDKQLNAGPFGQMHESLECCPKQFSELCARFLKTAIQFSDPGTLPSMKADLVLLNYYQPEKEGIYWHRDNSANERRACDLGLPVVSFSIGDSCVFEWKDEMSDPTKEIILDSGDVLIFGGASRMIYHAVPKIYPNTCPKGLKMPKGRINLTFRQQLEV